MKQKDKFCACESKLKRPNKDKGAMDKETEQRESQHDKHSATLLDTPVWLLINSNI